jgi:nucleoside-diphosphate-sugar epimerase
LVDGSWRPAGLGVAWARLFNLTGPGEDPRRLVPMVVRSLLDGKPVSLSAGAQVRDFLDVADVAAALVALSDAGAEGSFNVCSGEALSLRELLGAVGERVGRVDLLRFGERPYGEHDPPMVVGINRRLRAATHWQRRYDRDTMIDRVIDDCKRSDPAERES